MNSEFIKMNKEINIYKSFGCINISNSLNEFCGEVVRDSKVTNIDDKLNIHENCMQRFQTLRNTNSNFTDFKANEENDN